jgi:hypothetical protein
MKPECRKMAPFDHLPDPLPRPPSDQRELRRGEPIAFHRTREHVPGMDGLGQLGPTDLAIASFISEKYTPAERGELFDQLQANADI